MGKQRGALAPSPCLSPIQGEGWGEGSADTARKALPGPTPTPALPHSGGVSHANPWTERRLALRHGCLVLREAAPDAPGPPVLLLHGISSGAGSWAALADGLPGRRLLAWDTPGYGHSAALPQRRPSADDYAEVAALMLIELGVRQALLVGHSLGASIATALAARLLANANGPQPTGLLLLSPATGYAADPVRAAQVQAQRLQALAAQGVAGLAQTVSRRLLSAQASPAQHAQVAQVAQGLTALGYTQAVHLLCHSDLPGLLASIPPRLLACLPARMACGSDDIVTPPAACAALGGSLGLPFRLLPGAGHACAVEQPQAVAALIAAMLPQAMP